MTSSLDTLRSAAMGLSDMNIFAALACPPPVKPVTYSHGRVLLHHIEKTLDAALHGLKGRGLIRHG